MRDDFADRGDSTEPARGVGHAVGRGAPGADPTLYRELCQAVDEGFALIEMEFDAAGRATDYLFIDVNAGFACQTGLTDVVGKTIKSLVPDLEAFWFDVFGRVARTGEATRFRHDAKPMGRWFDVYAFRTKSLPERQVALLFRDVTAEQKMAQYLRETEIRYRSALRVGRIGAWETDLVNLRRIWSDEGKSLFGLALPGPYGVVGGPADEWRLALHPDDAGVADEVCRTLAKQDRLQVRYRIRRPDGVVLSLLGHTEVSQRGPDGSVERLIDVVADITEMTATEAALRRSETRFRAVQETSIDGFMVLDSVRDEGGAIADFRWSYVNDAGARIAGKPRDWFVGRSLLEEMPGNREEGLFDAYARVVETGEPWRREFTYQHEGLDLYIRAICAKVDDGIAISFVDLSERRRSEMRVQESEARLASALVAGELGVFDFDPRTGALQWDQAVRRIWGVPDDEAITNDTFLSGLHPDDVAPVESFLAAALDPAGSRRFVVEYRVINRIDGRTRWMIAHGDASFDGELPVRVVGTVRDVTDRKKAEADRRLLVEELNHRVKNTLATVKAIASQTLKGDNAKPEAREALNGRLIALAGAHDLLVRDEWSGARLRAVIEKALAAHFDPGSDRVALSGPDAALPAKAALALTMCLHELATNAGKYGALSTEAGRVDIVWSLEGPRLSLVWTESGGPSVTPPSRRGFGSRLVEGVLGADLAGEVRIEFPESGVICMLTAQIAPPSLS